MENNTQSNGVPLEEKILKRIPKEVFILSLFMAIAATLLFDIGMGLFVLAGGVLAAINFIWLNQTLTKILHREKRNALKTSGLLFGLRLVLILAVFFIIIFFFSNKIIAFAAGFSSIIVVLLFEALTVMSKLKTWKN
ncbi:MAG: ATP synthase subunit I [Candidatus Aminicenantes bacterium]|nr:MAG: ATP synthase subunit I [Candidatus Aminicenantes bacterium]